MTSPVENRILFHLGALPITQILMVSWAVMACVILAALYVRLRLSRNNPGKAQVAAEALVTWISDEIEGIVGRDPGPFIPLVASLFIFILASNFVTFISSFFEVVKPPTADITTTAALATIVFLAVPVYGIRMTGGLNYLKGYFRPVFFMLPFNIISELSRTLSLAVRLFGNIVSGEILFGVVVSLAPFFLPLPLMFLSLITGTIQAYIFAVLATVYIGGAVKVVEKKKSEETSQ